MYIVQTKSRNFPLETENAVLTSVAKFFTKSPKVFGSRSENDKKIVFFSRKNFSEDSCGHLNTIVNTGVATNCLGCSLSFHIAFQPVAKT